MDQKRKPVRNTAPALRAGALVVRERMLIQSLLNVAAVLMTDDDVDIVLPILILLYRGRLLMKRNIQRSVIVRQHRTVRSFTDQQCWEFFRFRRDDLSFVITLLALPEEIRTTSRCCFSAEESVLILLYRLNYPTRLLDMEEIFGKQQSHISEIVTQIIDLLLVRFADLLTDLRRWRPCVPKFVAAVAD